MPSTTAEEIAPELMTPDEYVGSPLAFRIRIARNEAKLAALRSAAAFGDTMAARELARAEHPESPVQGSLRRLREGTLTDGGGWDMRRDHQDFVWDALASGRSVHAASIAAYDEELPAGYRQIGDVCVGPVELTGGDGI